MSPQDAVKALIAAGMSEQGIADLCGCTQPTIHRVKQGRSCLWPTGQQIVKLATTKVVLEKWNGDRRQQHQQ